MQQQTFFDSALAANPELGLKIGSGGAIHVFSSDTGSGSEGTPAISATLSSSDSGGASNTPGHVTAPTLLATIADGSVGNFSYTTPAFSPLVGDLLIVAMNVDYDIGTFHVQPTITSTLSGVGAWTFIEQDNGQLFGNYLLIAYAKISSTPGTGTLTLNFGSGNNRDAMLVKVYSVTGYDTTTPISANVAGAAAGNGNGAVATFGLTPATDSLVFVLVGMVSSGSTQITQTPKVGYTELDDWWVNNPTYGFSVDSETSYLNGGATTSIGGGAASWTPNTDWIVLGIEVKAGSGAAENGTVDVASSTPISSSDSGSGAEGTPALTVTQSSSDTSSGTEGTPAIAATASGSDASVGAEGTPSISAVLSATEASSGADSGTSVALAFADSGAALEGSPALSVVLPGSDLGSGADVGSQIALAHADTGAGAEGTPTLGVSLAGSDTGSDTESTTIAATLAGSDSGSGADAHTLAVALSDTNSGAGSEGTPSLAVALAASDVGAGAEGSVSVDASGGDASKSDADSAAGADASTLAVTLSSADSNSDAENTAIQVALSSSDIGGGADTALLATTVAGSDTASAADNSALAVTLSGSEASSGADNNTGIALAFTDTGSGDDVLTQLAVALADIDAASGVEGESLGRRFSEADEGHGIDDATLRVFVQASFALLSVRDAALFTAHSDITVLSISDDTAQLHSEDNGVLSFTDSDVLTGG